MIRRPWIFLAALVFCWFGWPLLHPDYAGHDGDSLFLFLPAMEVAREQMLGGAVPLWNPYKFMGAPLLANLMVPVFYPPQWGALLAPQPFGLHVALVLHAVAGALGAYWLARRGFGVGEAGSFFAGMTFACCGPMTAHLTHPNQFFAMAWLPWVWLAAVVVCRGGHWGWLGGALGLQLLAGQPQIVCYSGVLIAATWGVDGGRRGRSLVGLAAGVAMAGGLAAVELAPAWELSRMSMRRAMGGDYATSFSLEWRNFATLLFPDALGAPGTGGYRGAWNFTETAIFLGQAAVAMAFIGAAARWRHRQVWLLAVCLAAGVVLALGGNTPVGGLVQHAPVISDFRAPARAFVVAALAVALLAGMGCDSMLGRMRTPAAKRAGLLLMLGAQVAGLAWFRFHLLGMTMTRLDVLEAPGIERMMVGARGRLLSLATEIDYGDTSPVATRLKVIGLQPDVNALRGIRTVMGYDEGMLPTTGFVGQMRYYWRNIYTAATDSLLMGVMGVEFLATDKPLEGAGWEPVGVQGGLRLWRNVNYRGDVFTRAQWPEVDFGKVAPARLDGRVSTQTMDFSQAVAAAPAPPIEWKREGAKIEVKLPEGFAGELLLAEQFMPGWRARVADGETIEGTRVSSFLIGFELPGGAEAATLEYRPGSFRTGGWVSLIALLGLLAAGGWGMMQRTRDRRATNIKEAL